MATLKDIYNRAMDQYTQDVYGTDGVAYTSPNTMQYHIDANDAAAAVPSNIIKEAVPGFAGQTLGLASDLAMPFMALGSSPFYDAYQGITRVNDSFRGAPPGYAPTVSDYAKGVWDEDIGKSMIGRTLGTGQNLARNATTYGKGIMEALNPSEQTVIDRINAANNLTPRDEPLDIEDFLGTSVPENVTIGQAPSVFDINTMGDPALNPDSVNAMGIDPYDVNENLIDRGNPYNDPRVVSEEQSLVGGITDRGRGMAAPGEMGAYEMIGGTPVAIGDVLGRQQALEKADFYEPSKKGMDLGLGSLLTQAIGTAFGIEPLTQLGRAFGAKNLYDNYRSGKLGQVLGAPKRGLSALNKKMRGVDPYTGRVNTQSDFDHNRNNRRTTNRINTISKTLDKWEANPTKYADQLKNTTLYDRRDNLRREQNKSNIAKAKSKGVDISSLNPNEMRNVSETGSPGGNSGSSKIVCTMMNERYGFGSFRNKIWMKFHENHGPEYQKGYHTIFLPLVKIAKGEGKLNTAVRKVLEHMGRHVTADMFKIMKGKKRDTLGRIYRAIFEPTCRIIGKIKSALGRG